MKDIKAIQKKAAGIADELIQLEKDSEGMLEAPESMADLPILKLQCRFLLGRVRALQDKVDSVEESMDSAVDSGGTDVGSMEATRLMLQQYRAVLKMKKVETEGYLETLIAAEKAAGKGNRK